MQEDRCAWFHVNGQEIERIADWGGREFPSKNCLEQLHACQAGDLFLRRGVGGVPTGTNRFFLFVPPRNDLVSLHHELLPHPQYLYMQYL